MTELTDQEFEILCLILKFRLQNKRGIPISIFLQFNWSIEESCSALYTLKTKGFLVGWRIDGRKSGKTKIFFKLPKQLASNLDLVDSKIARIYTTKPNVLVIFKEKEDGFSKRSRCSS